VLPVKNSPDVQINSCANQRYTDVVRLRNIRDTLMVVGTAALQATEVELLIN